MLTARDIQTMDMSNLEVHGVGNVETEVLYQAMPDLEELYEAEIVCAPDFDRLIIERTPGEAPRHLIPRIDAITILGSAMLAKAEGAAPGIINQQ